MAKSLIIVSGENEKVYAELLLSLVTLIDDDKENGKVVGIKDGSVNATIWSEKIYEDNVSGKISDERFSKLSVKYDTEQKELNIRVKELEDELAKKQNKSVSTDMFITSVRKYTRARKLTTKMLNELIEKIEVYQAEEIDGKRIQRLKIHYNCIGSIDEIPNIDKLPENNVSVHTRQGVDIHYAACAG